MCIIYVPAVFPREQAKLLQTHSSPDDNKIEDFSPAQCQTWTEVCWRRVLIGPGPDLEATAARKNSP